MTQKLFKFNCKQGQSVLVADALRTFGHPVILPERMGKDGIRSVWVVMVLPENVSEKQVNRHLHTLEIPGATSGGTNRPIVKGEKCEVIDKINFLGDRRIMDRLKNGAPFRWVCDGKFMGTYRLSVYRTGCTCCGDYDTIVPYNPKEVARSAR